MMCIGLTGGMASGKSTVSSMLRRAGITVVDADNLARKVVKKGTLGLKQIKKIFGEKIIEPSGELNRKRMAKLIFSDSLARKKLEKITHPLIAKELEKELQLLESKGKDIAVYEASLIFEMGLQSQLSATILVSSSEHIQVERLKKRDNLGPLEAKKRILAQMPLAEKERLCTVKIDNSKNIAHTAAQLSLAWEQITGQKIRFAPAKTIDNV